MINRKAKKMENKIDKFDRVIEKELEEWVADMQKIVEIIQTSDEVRPSVVAGIVDTFFSRRQLAVSTALYILGHVDLEDAQAIMKKDIAFQ